MIGWAWLCVAHSTIVGNVAPVGIWKRVSAHFAKENVCMRVNQPPCVHFGGVISFFSFILLRLFPSPARSLSRFLSFAYVRISYIAWVQFFGRHWERARDRSLTTPQIDQIFKTNRANEPTKCQTHTRKSQPTITFVTRVLGREFHERVFYFERRK